MKQPNNVASTENIATHVLFKFQTAQLIINALICKTKWAIMHIVLIVLYVCANLLCNGESASENGSIFRARNLKWDTSISLFCGGIPCTTDVDAMLQCHMEAGCMAAWFHLDGSNNAQCGTCVCMDDGMYVNEIAGATLHMKEFVKFIPGKIPDSKVHGTNMGPTWVLSALGGPHVGPINLLSGILYRYGTEAINNRCVTSISYSRI